MSQVYISYAMDRMAGWAKKVMAEVAEGDMLRTYMTILREAHQVRACECNRIAGAGRGTGDRGREIRHLVEGPGISRRLSSRLFHFRKLISFFANSTIAI